MSCKVTIMLLLTVLLIVSFPLFINGARELKEPTGEEKALHPDNFIGGGFGGMIPASPGAGAGTGVFPATPTVGLFPFPATPAGGATGFGSAPVDFCSVPSLGCVRVQPANPGAGAGNGGSGTPLPFP